MSAKRPNVEFVKLQSSAFLTDPDFHRFSAAERGVYCTLLFYLYCNNGRCALDFGLLGRICNCENFEAVWAVIRRKFQTRKGVIRHKRVTAELAEARRRMQKRVETAKKAAARRWQDKGEDGDPDAPDDAGGNAERMPDALPKETRGNETEIETQEKTRSKRVDTGRIGCGAGAVGPSDPAAASSNSTVLRDRASISLRSRALGFHDKLTGLIRPRSQSDRTCFANVARWLVAGCEGGRFNEQIFERVLDYAIEARSGRQPAAVFMSLLKKELGYEP